MDNQITDAREMLRVKSHAALASRHATFVKQAQLQPRTIDTPVPARIEHNRWLFDCVCGSGVAVHPDWPSAYCFGERCGRIYTTVVIPGDRHEIEGELLKRPVVNRNWRPGETLRALQMEFAINAGAARTKRGAVQP